MTAYPDLKRDLRFFPIENSSPKTLTPEQVAAFNRDGYVKPLRALSPDEVAKHRADFEAILAQELDLGNGSYSIDGWHYKKQIIYDIAKHPVILAHIEDLLGDNFLLWASHYFCKLPGDGRRVSWHQDASFWPLTPSKCVTVWLAIDDAMPENGCMRVVPKSHLHGQIPFRKSFADENNVLFQSVDNVAEWGEQPVDVTLKEGEFSLHADLLLHGSNENSSRDKRRCGLTLRYVPTDVVAPANWKYNHAILCKGSLPEGSTWNLIERPAA